MRLLYVLFIVSFLLTGCQVEQERYNYIGEGVVKRIEYLQGNFLQLAQTIIYLEDGSTITLNKIHSVPSGDIKIYGRKNGYTVFTEFRFEKINEITKGE